MDTSNKKEDRIHRFTILGTNIVTDINTGALFVLDDTSNEVLGLYAKNYDYDSIIGELIGRYDGEEIKTSYEEIKNLEQEGLLFTVGDYPEGFDVFPSVKAMCLNIAHDCNMSCEYCFASKGDFGSQRMLMDAKTGKKAIDFLIRNSTGRKNLEVDFFGGEPLMNFSAVKEIVEYARSREKEFNKNFRFTITTNGLLLNDEIMDYVNKNFVNIVFSLDGRKQIHDRMRKTLSGGDTYRLVADKIKRAVMQRGQGDYYVRGTFTAFNKDFSHDVLSLAEEGFKQISVEPVVAPDHTNYCILEEDLEEIKGEYEILAQKYLEYGKTDKRFNFFHFMIDLEQGPCFIKRYKGCGSGTEYIAITPEGHIYPCHQFVGMEEFIMGDLDRGIVNESIGQRFHSSNILTKDACRNCWARFYCSGGCAANAYNSNKDIDLPYEIGCELEKKRVECALWIKAVQLGD